MNDLERAIEILKPFADAADKADEKTAETERLGMGRLTDNASPGLGIKFGDLRRAREVRAVLLSAQGQAGKPVAWLAGKPGAYSVRWTEPDKLTGWTQLYRAAVDGLNKATAVQLAPAAPFPKTDWPEPKIANPDIAEPTGIPYIDSLIDQLLDAQQDINLEADERMSQPLCDASALIDEVETAIRRFAARAATPAAAPSSETAFERVPLNVLSEASGLSAIDVVALEGRIGFLYRQLSVAPETTK